MERLNHSKIVKILFIIFGGVLSYKVATRISGTDFISYVAIYENTQKIGLRYFASRLEPLFLLIFLLSPTQIIAFGLAGITAIYFKLSSILKFSYYPFLSLMYYVMYFFVKDEMGRVRAGIASAIMIYAVEYLEKKKYLLFLLIAFLFHKSSILYIFIYILYNKNLSKKRLEILFLFSVLLSFIDFSKILHFLVLIPYIKTTASEYILNIERIYFSPIMITKCIYIILFFLYYKKLSHYKYFKKLFLIYLVGNMIYFSFNSIDIIATRGSEIFTCIEFILLPYLLKISNKYITKTIIFGGITAYYIYISYQNIYYLMH